MKSVFGILGGDKRQLYLANSLQDDGYKVYICGFELSSETKGLEEEKLTAFLNKCDNIILPLPCTKDGVNIFAPYSCNDIPMNDFLIKKLENKIVFGGYLNKLIDEKDEKWKNIKLHDYYMREELAVNNAVPTAEGAISLAITGHGGILNSSKCLIAGYGRIGKILTKNLLGLGANVYVAARKKHDFAMIKAVGAMPIKYQDIRKEFDIIFNTVEHLVIDKSILSKQSADTVIIELASFPGGIDRKTATLNGIKIIDAQSLPGKYSPKATGEFIKEAIYNIMEEEYD
ncbi:MAG: dipicolinate synthase subunit DpsA [Clostridia bacterium]